jgi:hypothetical protein
MEQKSVVLFGRADLGRDGIHQESQAASGDVAAKSFGGVLDQSKVKQFLSKDHFSVDGTLIEARHP